jgi:hypothetical protein
MMLTDPRVEKRVKERVKVDHTHDIPYIAGYSRDGKTVYVDRHFPLKMDEVDILPYILTHEKTEKALLDYFHLDYEQAHHLATHAERMHANEDGINWKYYEGHCDKYERPLDHEKIQKVPNDLDLEPYADEKDPDYKKLVDKQRQKVNNTR